MNTPNFDEFSRRIEQVIQEHISECRRAAQGAMERAFAAAITMPSPPSAKGSPTRRERQPRRRRNKTELAALGNRLHEAVCANPGETMAALALRLETPGRDLHRPMADLKRLGKVRHVGARHLTRYFPLEACAA
jgi:hypothetical protein